MKIAHVAPLFETVSPRVFDGIGRVIHTLVQELSWSGHEVTLFATADSCADAEIVPCADAPIGSGLADSEEAAMHILEFDEVRRRAEEFDVIHFHTRFSHFPHFESMAGRTVTTCHNRVDLPGLDRFYNRFRRFPLIGISQAQCQTSPMANWAAMIHHGYSGDQYAYHGRPAGDGGYLAFLGRICPEKGVLDAIEISLRAQRSLKIAARINEADREYFESCVKPRLDHDLIEYVGEIPEDRKTEFLNDAAALLFPTRWPEPFGPSMIEAFACGLPVIAYRCGSAPEVVEQGVTGILVDTVEEGADAIADLKDFDRAAIRQRFEDRFSSVTMAARHVELYRRIADRSARGGAPHMRARRMPNPSDILGIRASRPGALRLRPEDVERNGSV